MEMQPNYYYTQRHKPPVDNIEQNQIKCLFINDLYQGFKVDYRKVTQM